MTCSSTESIRWLRDIFDRPVAKPEWYWQGDGETPSVLQRPPDRHIESFITLSCHFDAVFESLSVPQVVQGLWAISSGICTGISYAFTNESVPESLRVLGLQAMVTFFREYFAVQLGDFCATRPNDDGPLEKLSNVCFMWWGENISFWPDTEEDSLPSTFTLAWLQALDEVLHIPSLACQESALHALGHLTLRVPNQAKPIIQQYINQLSIKQERLRPYALRALEGRIQ